MTSLKQSFNLDFPSLFLKHHPGGGGWLGEGVVEGTIVAIKNTMKYARAFIMTVAFPIVSVTRILKSGNDLVNYMIYRGIFTDNDIKQGFV